MAHALSTSLRGALATKQSRILSRRDSGLLRCARNDGASFGCALSNSHFVCRHACAFSRRNSPELCLITPPPKSKRAQGRPGAGWHPRSAARIMRKKRPHSSIQVSPITRPSLRDGWTAYAVISREPTIPLASLAVRIDDAVHPVGLAHIFERLDRGNNGQDHTVLPYARPAMSPQFFQPCRRSRKLTSETKPDSAVVRTRLRTHRDYPPCPHLSCRRCRVHRKPGSRT